MHEIRLGVGGLALTKALAIMFIVTTLFATPASTQGFRRGFAPHPGFGHLGSFARPGFFPHGSFVNNRVYFRGFFVGPAVVPFGFPAFAPPVVYAPPPVLYAQPPVYALPAVTYDPQAPSAGAAAGRCYAGAYVCPLNAPNSMFLSDQ
jgi:hypothetical protein